MDCKAFTLLEPVGSPSPLVVDSPHSGRVYPDDFAAVCPLPQLRQTEDFMVDALVRDAVQAGATVIAAEFPRSYIDANRDENDIDPAVLAEPWDAPLQLTERTSLGLGLVRRLCTAGVPVYAQPLRVAAIRQRIEHYYRPYHRAVHEALEKRWRLFGVCYLFDCHSMPSRSLDEGHLLRPDFILGDRNGTSCDPALTREVSLLLQEMGYSVALNEPYKGMEIVRRYGRPQEGRHALQIEINRRLYMDEQRLELRPGADVLRQHLTFMFTVLAERRRLTPEQMAAE